MSDYKFDFLCSKKLEDLKKTGDEETLHCESCDNDVHVLTDPEKLGEKADNNQCIIASEDVLSEAGMAIPEIPKIGNSSISIVNHKDPESRGRWAQKFILEISDGPWEPPPDEHLRLKELSIGSKDCNIIVPGLQNNHAVIYSENDEYMLKAVEDAGMFLKRGKKKTLVKEPMRLLNHDRLSFDPEGKEDYLEFSFILREQAKPKPSEHFRLAGTPIRTTDLRPRGEPVSIEVHWHNSRFQHGVKHILTQLNKDGALQRVIDKKETGQIQHVDPGIFTEMWKALEYAGFPDNKPERMICVPDEGRYTGIVQFENQKLAVEIPSGEMENTAGWSFVNQKLNSLFQHGPKKEQEQRQNPPSEEDNAHKENRENTENITVEKLIEAEKWNRKVLEGLRKREKQETDPIEKKRIGAEIHAHEKRSRKVYVQLKAMGVLAKDKGKEKGKDNVKEKEIPTEKTIDSTPENAPEESPIKKFILAILILSVSFVIGYLLGEI